MRIFWILFFAITPIAAIALCVAAPSLNWWFPGESVSPLGADIDHLFYVINWIVGAVFVGTNVAIVYALTKGSAKPDEEKGSYVHGNHKLEIVWTAIPFFILAFIAVYQTQVWADMKIQSSFPMAGTDGDKTLLPVAEVQARQFEWRIRYPGLDESGQPLELDSKPQETDVWAVNELHVPAGQPVLIKLKTQDVQHSFYLPEFRIKQDAVPGLIIPVWFEASEPGEYVLQCAELCGWGHYKMSARVIALAPDEWDEWRATFEKQQTDDGVEVAEG